MSEIIKDEGLVGKYKTGQLLGDPSKWNTPSYILRQNLLRINTDKCSKEFLRLYHFTAQLLWTFRKHNHFLSYPDEKEIKVIDALGFQALEDLQTLKKTTFTYDANRSIFLGELSDGTLSDEDGYVYVPALDNPTTQGLLTDIIFAFGKKTTKIQICNEFYNTKNSEALKNYIINNSLSELFPAGALLPYINEDMIESNPSDFKIWDPSHNFVTFKHIEQKYLNLGYSPKDIKELKKDWEHKVETLKQSEIPALEDKVEFAKELVKNFTPEHYERFQNSLEKTN